MRIRTDTIQRVRVIRTRTLWTLQTLQRSKELQQQRISLPMSEAIHHAERLIAWLDDLLATIEGEREVGPSGSRPTGSAQ